MIGALAGDICGAPYEGGSCSRERFKFFDHGTGFTDDSVCSVAVADALLHHRPFDVSLREWVRRYPGRGYGGSFINWATSLKGPYGSFGNGGAMRVAACGWLGRSEDEVLQMAQRSAEVTHNHPEGLRGAQAIAAAIWWARQGNSPAEIRSRLAPFGYDLHRSVGSLKEVWGFSTLAEETVPEALICALSATSWEDAVLHAVEVGGDSDTLACMAGAVAEARFGIPLKHAVSAWSRLPSDMQDVVRALYERAGAPAPWLVETDRGTPLVVESCPKQTRRTTDLFTALKGWLSSLR